MTDDMGAPRQRGIEPEEELAIAEVRYMMSLMLLPHVSKYLTHSADLSAVVDDAAMRLYRTHKPGTDFDLGLDNPCHQIRRLAAPVWSMIYTDE